MAGNWFKVHSEVAIEGWLPHIKLPGGRREFLICPSRINFLLHTQCRWQAERNSNFCSVGTGLVGPGHFPPDCVSFNFPAVPRSYPRGRPCTDMDRPMCASRLPGSGVVDRWGSFAKPLFPWLLESTESGHSEPGAIPPAHPSPDLLCCPDAILLSFPS